MIPDIHLGFLGTLTFPLTHIYVLTHTNICSHMHITDTHENRKTMTEEKEEERNT